MNPMTQRCISLVDHKTALTASWLQAMGGIDATSTTMERS